MDHKVMYNLSYGLFVLTTSFEGKDNGCIINTAGQVTSEPNRISITVNNANYTTELIKKSGKFNISILSEDASFDILKHFGTNRLVVKKDFAFAVTVKRPFDNHFIADIKLIFP